MMRKSFPLLATMWALGVCPARAWDYEGHRLVNQLALTALPTGFPVFVQTAEAKERIAFLSGEPDRWRNSTHRSLRHVNAPDHFFDVDELSRHGLELRELPPFRYQFAQRIARSGVTATLMPARSGQDPDRTVEWPGFLPWAITEHFARLQSGFSTLKEFEAAGTKEEIANTRESIIYAMGVLGHFVGDAAQPLHTTIHYNGWLASNTQGYSTSRTFHAWVDGGFLARAKVDTAEMKSRMRPAIALPGGKSAGHPTNIFPAVVEFVENQFTMVEPLYKLEKAGKLSSRLPSVEGRQFLEGQLIKGGEMLARLWVTAWQEAPPDTYLRSYLARRKLPAD